MGERERRERAALLRREKARARERKGRQTA